MMGDRPDAASEIVATIERLLPPDPRLGDLVEVLGAWTGEILLAVIAIPAIIPVPGVPLGAVFGTVLAIINRSPAYHGADNRSKLMPVFKRELAFAADRPLENAGDWWHLVLDTDAPGLYVEHTWMHASSHLDGQAAQGTQRFGINDFLTLAEGRPAQPVLMNALRELFRSAAPTSE